MHTPYCMIVVLKLRLEHCEYQFCVNLLLNFHDFCSLSFMDAESDTIFQLEGIEQIRTTLHKDSGRVLLKKRRTLELS